jgi:ubiquinone/menaquinone biosynthesis C-methylase UbiE
LDNHTRVVDIACGKGTSAVYLAQRYGCEVVGIDISADLIAQARTLAKKKGLEEKVIFRVGDALKLPFLENEFDVAVSQAMLVLVTDKQKAIQEALRVTKPGGYFGWLELSWKKQPTADFLDAVSNVLCAYIMQNVSTFQGWADLFKEAGINQLAIQCFDLGNTGLMDMLGDEGFINTCKVMFKYMTNSRIRKRMKTMNRFFKEHTDYFGYGIFTGRK